MLDDLIETAIPWGGFLAVGALLGASFPDETKDLARRAALLGMRIADKAREVGAEGWERGQDILAEAEAERAEERRRGDAPTRSKLTVVDGRATPRRRTASRSRTRTAATRSRAAVRTPRTRPVDTTEN